MKTTAILSSLLAGAALLAAAHPAAAGEIDWRQRNQQHRIEQGVRSGELNRWEYRRLQEQQLRIAEMERRARRDGVIDPWERAQIRRAQNEASRSIYREKHDGETRWSRWSHRRWWW